MTHQELFAKGITESLWIMNKFEKLITLKERKVKFIKLFVQNYFKFSILKLHYNGQSNKV